MGATIPRIISMEIISLGPPPAPKPKQWSCDYCDALNHATELRCDNCGAAATINKLREANGFKKLESIKITLPPKPRILY